MRNTKIDWRGSFAVIVTPFNRGGDVDEEAYRQVLNWSSAQVATV